MSQQPWASGPGEILEFAISLLSKDTDTNRRLAMILIDNSVELMMKTYLGLPKRITGITLGREKYNEISQSFPKLLDALEQHANAKIGGIDLGEIEWYHRLRNQLYHEGNGLTVERTKVEVYSQLARLLFHNLFGIQLQLHIKNIDEITGTEILGRFLEAWIKFEQAVESIAVQRGLTLGNRRPMFPHTIQEMVRLNLIDQKTNQEIQVLRNVRNEAVHGQIDFKTAIKSEMVDKIQAITALVESNASR